MEITRVNSKDILSPPFRVGLGNDNLVSITQIIANYDINFEEKFMAKKTNFNTNDYEYYRVNAVVGRNPDGTYIRKQFYGLSKKEAESKKKEYLDGISSGLNLDYREMSIKELMKLWLFNVVRVDKSFSTFDRYESVYRNYIVDSQLACLKVYLLPEEIPLEIAEKMGEYNCNNDED